MMIAGYTLYQLAWYFVLYSFIGWCVEVVFCAVTLGTVTNRGFLNGPVCPIYGCGMLIVLILLHLVGETDPVKVSIPLLFFGGAILATIVELLGGILLNRLFHARWWDYSDKPFNIGGYVCLEFSIFWGLGAIGIVRGVQPLLAHATGAGLPEDIGWPVLGVLYAIYLVDLIVTVCTVIGLNRDLQELDSVSRALRSLGDSLSDNLGGGALLTTQKLDEGKLQVKLATAEARDAAVDVRDSAAEAAGRAKVAATEAVSTAKVAATEAVSTAKVAATEAVSTAKVAATEAVSTARVAATEAVSTARAAATGAVYSAKDAAVTAMSSAKAAVTGAASTAKAAATDAAGETRAALEARASALRADILDHSRIGGGRLLKAFPRLAHDQYKSIVDDLKARMAGRQN